MSSNNSADEKTEDPSVYRLKQARKKGERIYSRELHFFLTMVINCCILWIFSKKIFFYFYKVMNNCLFFNNMYLDDEKNMVLYLENILKEIIIPFTTIIFSITIITLMLAMSLSGSIWNFRKIKFDIKRVSLYQGLKRNFSLQIWKELFKTVLRFVLMMLIFIWYLRLHFIQISMLLFEKSYNYLYYGCSILFFSVLTAVFTLIPMVLLDIYWQYNSYYKRLRMSLYEIKEEFKQIEGNPQIKSRMRQEMKLRLSQKIIFNIDKANVIITNPVHYAVALYYDESKMNAPKIIAKGSGYLALQICTVGKKNLIPILEYPKLARSLYKTGVIGHYITEDFYVIVAEVLAWIWRVQEWRKEGGVFPQKPNDLVDNKY
ncbi:flagellar type III secretion system protein FlhB [Buchnera aphidicola (Hormaphis cornu)]|nr:flagellar type III secretion system protein FlhB [Buchnera aphidicola (Hormaphis cornu)]